MRLSSGGRMGSHAGEEDRLPLTGSWQWSCVSVWFTRAKGPMGDGSGALFLPFPDVFV